VSLANISQAQNDIISTYPGSFIDNGTNVSQIKDLGEVVITATYTGSGSGRGGEV
jgi:hypothetical protein